LDVVHAAEVTRFSSPSGWRTFGVESAHEPRDRLTLADRLEES
jgi:hypothetical protein